MIFGISSSLYTNIHVIISLIAIVTGFIVVFGMLAGRPLGVWNTIFLWTTIADQRYRIRLSDPAVTPRIVVGIISLLFLAVALFALYLKHLTGAWRWIYVDQRDRSRCGSTCSF